MRYVFGRRRAGCVGFRGNSFWPSLFAGVLLVLSQTGWAGGQDLIYREVLPARPGVASDVRVTIDLPEPLPHRFMSYRVRVDMRTGKPSRRRRRFRVELSSSGRSGSLRVVSQVDVVLEQGKRSGEAWGTLLPTPGPVTAYVVTTTEDGSRVVALDAYVGGPSGMGAWRAMKLPEIVVLDRDVNGMLVPRQAGTLPEGDQHLPDLRPVVDLFSEVFPDDETVEEETGQAVREPWTIETARYWYGTMIGDDSKVYLRPRHPALTTRRWRDYDGCILAVISLEDLRWWSKQNSTSFEAFRDWVYMGGRVAVLGAGTAEARTQVQSIFGVPEGVSWSYDRRPRLEVARYTLRMWRDFTTNASRAARVMVNRMRRMRSGPLAVQAGAPASPPERLEQMLKEVAPESVQHCRAGWGTLLAVDEAKLDEAPLNWLLLLTTGGHSTTPLALRSEYFQDNGIGDYFRLVIPGVGQPPVGLFLTVITLFVLTIGPVNFYWFSDHRRRPLVLVTIPLLALVTTIGFIAVSTIKDGFRTRGRVRSVVYLDQERGRAFSWSRQSYFAAFASSGLTYPRGSRVMPARSAPLPAFRRSPPLYRVRSTGERELFSGDYIRARRLSQVVVGSVAPSDRRLLVQPTVPGKLRVRNGLGSRIELLLLRDAEGAWYVATNLEPDTTMTLAASSPAKVDKACGDWSQKRRHMQQRLMGGAAVRRRGVLPSLGGGWEGTSWKDQLMEPEIRRLFAEQRLEPGEFAAIVSVAVDVPRGIPIDTSFPDLECIFGRW